MTDDGIEGLVTRLYAASGAREAMDVDFEVYAEALEAITDEDGLAAGRYLIKHVDLVSHRPSPALVREQVQVILRERDMRRPALVEDTGPPVSREVALARIAALKQRHPKGSDPQPISVSLPKLRGNAHDFGDHHLCGLDCPDRPATA